MSSEMVKRSLQLFDDQIKQKTGGNSHSSKKNKNIKDGMKLISTNKQGVWKELRHLHKTYAIESKKKRKLKKKISTLEEYREKADKDHTKKNVKLLKQVSNVGKVKSVYCKKILEQHQRKLAKDLPQESREEPDSVFTDRDFDQFEQEYDYFQKLQ
ncbi:active regulator of SIRT1 [Patella vulgata]|uniref:active regulator of SIRT1 n=1 Tax=Patella vulgata TaxID=6465 RepID=UPI0024A89E26|nr:active regulator of SIRT1 [Patella vulgata]